MALTIQSAVTCSQPSHPQPDTSGYDPAFQTNFFTRPLKLTMPYSTRVSVVVAGLAILPFAFDTCVNVSVFPVSVKEKTLLAPAAIAAGFFATIGFVDTVPPEIS